ncbi:hypothetical protein BT96DRAFT_928153 [Gymnopus androsaceus JB14]|uniref:Uncharacterized protein n=1 Tax=Gymnopus androsaceus JB14 TaxID=1447944 RepID=A0A6A4GLF3_9AGAR|nr:hypothetical protein BT96DRAFT_928153 [Gymnopus androsaceus JB14]
MLLALVCSLVLLYLLLCLAKVSPPRRPTLLLQPLEPSMSTSSSGTSATTTTSAANTTATASGSSGLCMAIGRPAFWRSSKTIAWLLRLLLEELSLATAAVALFSSSSFFVFATSSSSYHHS